MSRLPEGFNAVFRGPSALGLTCGSSERRNLCVMRGTKHFLMVLYVSALAVPGRCAQQTCSRRRV